MDTLLQRVRGALGLGLVWGLAWFTAGMALLLVVGPDAADVPFPLGFGALGFLAGIVFSGVLALAEGRRSFEQMSLGRFAAWGAVGGAAFASVFGLAAGLTGELIGLVPIFALAGAGSAAGTLALARKATGQIGGRADEPPALQDR